MREAFLPSPWLVYVQRELRKMPSLCANPPPELLQFVHPSFTYRRPKEVSRHYSLREIQLLNVLCWSLVLNDPRGRGLCFSLKKHKIKTALQRGISWEK